MAKCKLSGKGPQYGNNLPWSKKTTRRRWQPNVQKYSIFVPELGRTVKIKASTRAMKSVNKLGLMAYLRKHNLTLKDVT
ncbi:MAG: 50S ribosomal protein L28 [Caldilineaceae bacterium]|nr:50S ribosomal protein L28 [Caldilineaceae bacterium]MCB9138287.1 50S ribosomal protein L28 [Caldilineaceae bacterium]